MDKLATSFCATIIIFLLALTLYDNGYLALKEGQMLQSCAAVRAKYLAMLDSMRSIPSFEEKSWHSGEIEAKYRSCAKAAHTVRLLQGAQMIIFALPSR